jgi:hypothetical protein
MAMNPVHGFVNLGSQLTDSSHGQRPISLPRGIIVSYEAIRRWCWKFGPGYARRLKKKQGRLGDTLVSGRTFR